jgi:hypothetical protein
MTQEEEKYDKYEYEENLEKLSLKEIEDIAKNKNINLNENFTDEWKKNSLIKKILNKITYEEWSKFYNKKIVDLNLLNKLPYEFKKRNKFLKKNFKKKDIAYFNKYLEQFIQFRFIYNTNNNFNFNNDINIFEHEFHRAGDFFNDKNIFELKVLQKPNIPYSRVKFNVNKVKDYFNDEHDGCNNNNCNCITLKYKKMRMHYLVYKNNKLHLYSKTNNYKSFKQWYEVFDLDKNIFTEMGYKWQKKNNKWEYIWTETENFYIYNKELIEINIEIKIPEYLKLILGIEKTLYSIEQEKKIQLQNEKKKEKYIDDLGYISD